MINGTKVTKKGVMCKKICEASVCLKFLFEALVVDLHAMTKRRASPMQQCWVECQCSIERLSREPAINVGVLAMMLSHPEGAR